MLWTGEIHGPSQKKKIGFPNNPRGKVSFQGRVAKSILRLRELVTIISKQ